MQPSDDHIYDGITVSSEMLRLFANACRFYADRLESDIATFKLDEELAKLLDDRTLRSFHASREITRSRDIASRAEALVAEAESMGDAEMLMTHGHARRLKAVSLLYIGELERRRNAVATERALTTLGLQILDTKLLELREKMEMGVFGQAEPIALLIAPEAAVRPAGAADAVTIKHSHAGLSLSIIDQELRERCVDMFNTFDGANQNERFDTVIVEATRILEDRLRKASGLGPESSGLDLVSAAFGGKAPRLRASSHTPEQEGVHSLFRGLFGFIRNPVHHRLQDIQRERAVQVMAFIDYLLHTAESAEPSPPNS